MQPVDETILAGRLPTRLPFPNIDVEPTVPIATALPPPVPKLLRWPPPLADATFVSQRNSAQLRRSTACRMFSAAKERVESETRFPPLTVAIDAEELPLSVLLTGTVPAWNSVEPNPERSWCWL